MPVLGLPPTVWLHNPWLFFYLLMPMLAVGLVLIVPWLASIGTIRRMRRVLKWHMAIAASLYL